jgi:PAS domain S-box-containing protein
MRDANAPPPSPDAPLPAAALAAWLDQSHDLLALTDAAGALRWCNPAFAQATGIAPPASLLDLAPSVGAGSDAGAVLSAALRAGHCAETEVELRSRGGATLWARMRVTTVADDRLWTLRDTTSYHVLAESARQLSELLDMAREFGRLGIWERNIPSGTGRWDRHVFEFWGMEPSGDTPDHAEASSRIHPEDQSRLYLESTRRAGRYAQRYRVVWPDGGLRWIHSHWEVKNSAQGVPDRAIGIMVDDTEVYELARSRDAAAAQLRLATELADIVIWRHDLKTNRIHYNEHGFKVLGLPCRSGGLPLAEARAPTHPEDVPKLAASSAHALATGVPVDVEVRHRRSDGAWRDILVRRVIERSASGEPLAFVGVSLDVTDQVERARRAEQLSRQLEAAARAARIGIWSTRLDAIETEWNAQMYELFDMVGAERPPTLAEWIAQRVHPDDGSRVSEVARRHLRERQGGFEIEFRIRRRDGAIRWMVLRADIDRSDAEKPGVFGIAMDVTERHDALGALHAASERSALIARHAGIGTWETNAQGLPVLWDDQMWRLRGLEPGALPLDREARLALVHPDDRAHVLDADPGRERGPQSTAYEFRIRWPDGSYRWLASRSAALRDDQGRVTRRVGVNWDITDAKNAALAHQQALLAERESQAKSQFLSRMSHELRTPLNAVLGFTQLLQLDAQQSADRGRIERLGHIRSAGEHLLTLIDDALDLSSLQSGTLRLDLQAVSVPIAAAQAMPLVEALAQANDIRLVAGTLDGTVLADPTRLRQILLNLLTNAIKYNRAGGQVVVGAAVDGAFVRLQVRDTGRGLRPDQLDHLFEPFNRLGMDREGIEGSGIGLTIVKALIEAMGGRIGVTSEPGRGTVFEVLLPRTQAVPAVQEPAARPEMTPKPAPPRRSGQLLYIEDNSVNVLLVEELVKGLSGLRIASEATGAAGVERALALRPDLILIDMQLPDFDGFEVLRQLRGHPQTATIPCIALSANAMPDDIARAMASGFDDYWTKPIRFKPFLDALERRFPALPPAH